jgi:hypothetical protein
MPRFPPRISSSTSPRPPSPRVPLSRPLNRPASPSVPRTRSAANPAAPDTNREGRSRSDRNSGAPNSNVRNRGGPSAVPRVRLEAHRPPSVTTLGPTSISKRRLAVRASRSRQPKSPRTTSTIRPTLTSVKPAVTKAPTSRWPTTSRTSRAMERAPRTRATRIGIRSRTGSGAKKTNRPTVGASSAIAAGVAEDAPQAEAVAAAIGVRLVANRAGAGAADAGNAAIARTAANSDPRAHAQNGGRRKVDAKNGRLKKLVAKSSRRVRDTDSARTAAPAREAVAPAKDAAPKVSLAPAVDAASVLAQKAGAVKVGKGVQPSADLNGPSVRSRLARLPRRPRPMTSAPDCSMPTPGVNRGGNPRRTRPLASATTTGTKASIATSQAGTATSRAGTPTLTRVRRRKPSTKPREVRQAKARPNLMRADVRAPGDGDDAVRARDATDQQDRWIGRDL